MEMFNDNSNKKKPSERSKDQNFILVKSDKMDMFKIEIFSGEFLDIIADIISNPGTRYNTIEEMVESIKKPIEMKIDAEVYKNMLMIGERADVELVCKYVAIQRILDCGSNKKLIGMMDNVKKSLMHVPVSTRHVLCSEKYKTIFALIGAAYLSSVCNLSGVGSEIAKMDKSNAKMMTAVMDQLKELTECEDSLVGEAYSAVVDLVERILFAYRDANIIDLGNVRKQLLDMFDGKLREYFNKLILQIDKDMNDSFSKFTDLVREMKDADDNKYSSNEPEPYEYDTIEIEITPEENMEPDLNNDSILGPDENASPVNTGLEDNTEPIETPITVTVGAGGGMDTTSQPGSGGVVNGLESVMTEAIFKKKLKRISREVVAYVKVRGMNAKDADDLTMIASYAYSVIDRLDWYMDIIERQDDRYVVPQSYGELSSIKDQLTKVADEILKNPVFRQKGSVFSNSRGIDY